MAVVYWIHHSSTMDKNEGYIGVSEKIDKRIYDHFRLAKSGKHNNIHLQRAITKYNDIQVDILFEGSLEDCLAIEIQYRPFRQMGWNIAEGGGLPPKRAGHISAWRGKNHPAASENMKKLHSEKKLPYADKNLVGKSWWNNGSKNVMSKECPGDGYVKGRLIKPYKKRNPPIVIVNETTMTLKEAAKYLGISYSQIRGKYYSHKKINGDVPFVVL